MRIVAFLMISLFLFTGCHAKSQIVKATINFAEIYKDNKGITWFRFRTYDNSFLLRSTLDVNVVAPDSTKDNLTTTVVYVVDDQNNASDVLINLGTQEEMHRWRNAIKQAEPRVLYPLFEFKEDEVAK